MFWLQVRRAVILLIGRSDLRRDRRRPRDPRDGLGAHRRPLRAYGTSITMRWILSPTLRSKKLMNRPATIAVCSDFRALHSKSRTFVLPLPPNIRRTSRRTSERGAPQRICGLFVLRRSVTCQFLACRSSSRNSSIKISASSGLWVSIRIRRRVAMAYLRLRERGSCVHSIKDFTRDGPVGGALPDDGSGRARWGGRAMASGGLQRRRQASVAELFPPSGHRPECRSTGS